MSLFSVANPPRKNRSQPIRTLRLSYEGREIFRLEPGQRIGFVNSSGWTVSSPEGLALAVIEDVDYGDTWLQKVGTDPQEIDERHRYVPAQKGSLA